MKNTGITYTSAERSPVILPEMAELLPPLSAEQLDALEADLTGGLIFHFLRRVLYLAGREKLYLAGFDEKTGLALWLILKGDGLEVSGGSQLQPFQANSAQRSASGPRTLTEIKSVSLLPSLSL